MSEKLYSIKEETLNEFGTLCRDLTNSEESFNIDGMQDVLGWAQEEAVAQAELIDQINMAIATKTSTNINNSIIKFVKNYRQEGMTDSQVIAAAIRDTNDYETLIFEDGYTYQLTEPIFFTEYGERAGNRISGRNKTGINFLGNGCIITSNIEKLSVKGYLRANENGTDYSTATTLAVVSDNVNRHDGKGNALGITTTDEHGQTIFKPYFGNGLTQCIISGFNFQGGSGLAKYSYDGFHCITSEGSPYINKCKIMYCTFKLLASGFYTCGSDNEYCYNYFESCKKGAYDDGSVRANYHDNYFFTTRQDGIYAQQSYDTTIEHNRFYKCKGNAITLNGAQPRQRNDSTSIKCVVTKNIITGSGQFLLDGKQTYENGIVSQGYKDLIISNNMISSMASDNRTNGVDTTKSYGYGIWVGGGYNSVDSCRISSRVIVENNIIYSSARNAIRIRYANNVKVSNNSIYGYGGDASGIIIKKTDSEEYNTKNGTFSIVKGEILGQYTNSWTDTQVTHLPTAISVSLATNVVIDGNSVQNYIYYDTENNMVDQMISDTSSLSKIYIKNNTSIEGVSWEDTKMLKPDINKINHTLDFSKSSIKVILREGVSYSIWIPAANAEFTKEKFKELKESNKILYYVDMQHTGTYTSFPYTNNAGATVNTQCQHIHIYQYRDKNGSRVKIPVPISSYGHFQNMIYRIDSEGVGYFEIENGVVIDA